MADPLSIAAGIAGFLSLGIHVAQALVDFYAVYKMQDTNVAKVTQLIDRSAEWTSECVPGMACDYVEHESTILRRKGSCMV